MKDVQNIELKRKNLNVKEKRVVIVSDRSEIPGREGMRSITLLSPVILSDDQKKAVLTIMNYSGPEAAGCTVLFFEKKNGKWEIIDKEMLWIS